jgi:hypothetical protein
MSPRYRAEVRKTFQILVTGVALLLLCSPAFSQLNSGSIAGRITHYNHARVHTSLGPGVPDPIRPSPPMSGHRHHLPAGHVLRSKPVLGGLHHEYWLEKVAV